MLSLFPELFDLGFYVPFVFRMVLGYYLLKEGYRLFSFKIEGGEKNEQAAYRTLGGLILLDGLLLFVGVYLQVAAAVATGFGLVALFLKYQHSTHVPQTRGFYILATLIALSLIVLGPGMYAIDLPL